MRRKASGFSSSGDLSIYDLGMKRYPSRSFRRWLPVILLAVSLAIRLGVWWTATPRMPPRYDETAYFERSVHFAHLLKAATSEETAKAKDREGFYWEGRWPPLHPMIQGTMLWATGSERPWISRLVPVLLSALTTWVVFVLTRRLAGRFAACVAALLHAVHPSFIAFSHLMWTESTYLLFWLLLLLAAVRAVDGIRSGSWRAAWSWSVITGLGLGLAGLTRATALPLFLLLPAWFLWKGRAHSARAAVAAGVALVVGCLVILPWQLELQKREGKTLLLTAFGWENVYLGNNPYVPEGFGSTWGHPESRTRAHLTVVGYAREKEIHRSDAARELALKEIRQNPRLFLQRCALRARMLFGTDFFTVRHLASATYPPGPKAWLGWLWMWLALAHVGTFGLAAWGLQSRSTSHRSLLLLASLAVLVPPLVSVSMSRLNLPLQAMALPLAGVGLMRIKSVGPAFRWKLRPSHQWAVLWTAATLFVVVGATWATLPKILRHHLDPSAYYRTALEPASRALGVEIRTSDRILLRRTSFRGPPVQIDLGDGYRFPSGRSSKLWRPPGKAREVDDIDVFAEDPELDLEWNLTPRGSDQPVRFRPLEREAWRRWQPTGVDGMQYRWQGFRTRNLR
jgi:4-amino-4-deoxy-L-arabinose transferase-like glycosyltransferase